MALKVSKVAHVRTLQFDLCKCGRNQAALLKLLECSQVFLEFSSKNAGYLHNALVDSSGCVSERETSIRRAGLDLPIPISIQNWDISFQNSSFYASCWTFPESCDFVRFSSRRYNLQKAPHRCEKSLGTTNSFNAPTFSRDSINSFRTQSCCQHCVHPQCFLWVFRDLRIFISGYSTQILIYVTWAIKFHHFNRSYLETSNKARAWSTSRDRSRYILSWSDPKNCS